MATANTAPACPRCQAAMKLRRSARGEFWGCSAFPNCRGTREVGKENAPAKAPAPVAYAYEPIVKMPGSSEQEAIWDFMLHGTEHGVVNAGPGTGKTWTMIQYCLRAPARQNILFVAFNRHIAMEANGKLAASGCHNVKASTYHSLGLAMLRQQYRNVDVNDHKVTDILEALSPEPLYNKGDWRRMLNLAAKLVGYAKNYLLDADAGNFRDELERVADHHGVDMNGSFQQSAALVRPALEESKRRASSAVDYDDMIWLPVVLDLAPTERYGVMITDESQDLNTVQHELMLKLVGRSFLGDCTSCRAVVVGDRHQAIYGFRGASTASIETLSERLGNTPRGVREFPLTITRRCPKLHVQLAQSLFPGIRALDDAPEGEIWNLKPDEAVAQMRPGDMVICRVNKELIPTAYALIRRGVRPVIKGRDIGKGLLDLLALMEKAVAPSTDRVRVVAALAMYRQEQLAKLLPLGERAEGRIAAMNDKCDCLLEFLENSATVTEARSRIETIFSDDVPNNAVVLGTVHRTKGLEAERVFVLAPDLIPHPMAKKEWERAQERNLAWVAATRAKFSVKTTAPGTLIFCGETPSIYGSQLEEE